MKNIQVRANEVTKDDDGVVTLKGVGRILLLKAQAAKILLDDGKLEAAKKELEKVLALLS